jgi:hypothetical protein
MVLPDVQCEPALAALEVEVARCLALASLCELQLAGLMRRVQAYEATVLWLSVPTVPRDVTDFSNPLVPGQCVADRLSG